MSYDVSVEMSAGGTGVFRDYHHINYTSNMAQAWRKAGVDIAEFEGKQAAQCIKELEAAIVVVEKDLESFKIFEPANGWGDVSSMLEKFLKPLLQLFLDYPNATVRVSH